MFTQRDIVFAALIGIAYFLLSLPFATVGIDAHHDAVMLKPAADVSRGAVLHRDTFTQYGPATTLVQSVFLRAFGVELRVLRVAAVVAYSFSLMFLCLFWRYFLPWSLVLAAVFWFLCSVYYFRPHWVLLPWASGMALCAQSFALLLMSLACRTELYRTRLSILAVAGAVVSLVFWFRQPVGAALSLAGMAVPVGLRWVERPGRSCGSRLRALSVGNPYLWAYSVGGLVVAAAFVSGLWFAGALNAWYVQTVVWPGKWASGLSSAKGVYRCFGTAQVLRPLLSLALSLFCLRLLGKLNRRWAIAGGVVWVLSWCLLVWVRPVTDLVIFDKLIPIGCCAILIGWGLPGPRGGPISVLSAALVISAMSSWAQYYPVPCIRHMFWGAAPMIGVFVFLLRAASGVSPRMLAVGLLVFAMPLAIGRFSEANMHMAMAAAPRKEAGLLHGMRPYLDSKVEPHRTFSRRGYEQDCRRFEELRNVVMHSGEARPVVLYGADALWTMVTTNPEHPGPFYVVWGGWQEFGVFDERDRYIRERKPWVIVQDRFAAEGQVPVLEECGYTEVYAVEAFGDTVRLYDIPKVSP